MNVLECPARLSMDGITQAFNTASSMGRLTLNVLLSFAQFEREVTAKRIRDKIAASKRQGLWMGGIPPLGYDPHPDPTVRELVINEAEAKTIRTLFGLYDRHGSLVGVEREAAQLGLRSKRHHFRSGRTQGGGHLSRGQIHKILLNPVYLGRIRHKDKVWPGRHPAVLEEALWERIQEKLQSAARRRRGHKSNMDGSDPAPLTGKLRDETGDRLTPTHTTKTGQRHRYYVSNRLITGGPDPSVWRLPGPKLEAIITNTIADHIVQATTGRQLLVSPDLRADTSLLRAARDLVKTLRTRDPKMLIAILVSGTLRPRQITLTLDRAILSKALDVVDADLSADLSEISVPVSLRRMGVEAKLVVGDLEPAPDPVLLRTLAEAHRWVESLRTGTPIKAVAGEAGHHEVFIRTRGQLAFLSPKIQASICAGTQPPEVTLKRILARPVPLAWESQERLYGIR